MTDSMSQLRRASYTLQKSLQTTSASACRIICYWLRQFYPQPQNRVLSWLRQFYPQPQNRVLSWLRQFYPQPQSSALSNLAPSFLVCSLIFIEYYYKYQHPLSKKIQQRPCTSSNEEQSRCSFFYSLST